jgi:hypothetical protein
MKPIRLTWLRRQWLERLAEEGPQERDHTTTGYYCMQAGWTEWIYRDGTEYITGHEARARYGDRFWDQVESAGERITKAGLKILREEHR